MPDQVPAALWNNLIVGSLVALCAVYALWRLVRWLRGGRGPDCGCGDCPSKDGKR